MYRRGREGEVGAGVFHNAADLVVDPLPDLQVLVLVGGFGEVQHFNVLAEVPELFEGDGENGAVEVLILFEEFS